MTTSLALLEDEPPERLDRVRALLDRARHDDITYTRSPDDWRDQVFYFLLPDRFSDEDLNRPQLCRQEILDLRQGGGRQAWSWKDWADSGRRWQGGTIGGIRKRLGYLEDLGVTAIWVGPVFKQRVRLDTYHGYGIQDFLDVDPRFGSRRDLIELVADAHTRGLRIILDVIVNHTGDNWAYVPPGRPLAEGRNQPPYRHWPDYYGNPTGGDTARWRLAWRGEDEAPFTLDSANVARPHDGVWPRELHAVLRYTRAGMGNIGESNIAYPVASAIPRSGKSQAARPASHAPPATKAVTM